MGSESQENVMYLYKGHDRKITLVYRSIFFALVLKTVIRDIFYYLR